MSAISSDKQYAQIIDVLLLNLFILIKIARIVSTEEYGQFTFLIVHWHNILDN